MADGVAKPNERLLRQLLDARRGGQLNTIAMAFTIVTANEVLKLLKSLQKTTSNITSQSTPMATSTLTGGDAQEQLDHSSNGIFHGEPVTVLAHADFKLQAAQTPTAVEPGDESALAAIQGGLNDDSLLRTIPHSSHVRSGSSIDSTASAAASAGGTTVASAGGTTAFTAASADGTTASAAASGGGTTASAAASAGVFKVCARVALTDVLYHPKDQMYNLAYTNTTSTTSANAWFNPALPTHTMVVAAIINSNPAPVFAVSPMHVHNEEVSNARLPVRSTLRAYPVAHDGTVHLTTADGQDGGVVVEANTPIEFAALASDTRVGSTFNDSVAVLVVAAMPRESVRMPTGWELDFVTHVLQ